MINRSTALQVLLFFVLVACLAACDSKHPNEGNNANEPRGVPDAEYPGTEAYDSLKNARLTDSLRNHPN